MPAVKFPKVAQLRTVERFQEHLRSLGIELPCDEEVLSKDAGSPLAQTLKVGNIVVGNRWCIHPMEGWDANQDGSPTELTVRRWKRFGESGAKLIWGGEAAAVHPEGRANPNQTLAVDSNLGGLRTLLSSLESTHAEKFGGVDDLLVGLQLTHSGRFCKPHNKSKWESKIAYHHPVLDAKFGIDSNDDSMILSDSDLEELIDAFVNAASLAKSAGFRFVDIKACHGYLLHEVLSGRTRPGKFGGDLDGRSRMLLEIIQRIKHEIPDMIVGVRLSLFDMIPYTFTDDGSGPMPWDAKTEYECGFGVSASEPTKIDVAEPLEIIRRLQSAGVAMVNLSGGSPYYTPHIQRPAAFPPSDGYPPPEDPLVGVARHIHAVAQVKEAIPDMPLVGSGYTYLQEFLPHVAQAVVRNGGVDFVGLGRMVLSHPTLPADTLAGQSPSRKLICRTFSDCTSAPRNGMLSGCFPLDDYYKQRPEREILQELKSRASAN